MKKNKKWQVENQLKYGEHYTHYYVDDDNRITNDTAIEQVQFVCTKGNGELVSPDSIKYCSRVINYELMIQFNFHALRHTHATLLIENGANMKDVQERLGHSKLATTMDTYTHVTENMSKRTVDIFEKAVLPTE